jgi:hypothetical protein
MYSEPILERTIRGHLIFSKQNQTIKQSITGKCILFSNGQSEFFGSFVPSVKFHKTFGLNIPSFKAKDFDIKFIGKTTDEEEIIATCLFLNSMPIEKKEGKKVRFKPKLSNCKTVIIKKGTLQDDIQFQYFLNNFDIGQIINDRTFAIGKLKFDVFPHTGYNDNLKKLKKFSGVLPTAVLICNKGKFSEKHTDCVVKKALDFLSFAKSTHISYVLKEKIGEQGNYEIEFTDHYAMPYNSSNYILDFNGHKMKDIVEPALNNYNWIQKKYNILHLLQIFLDTQNSFFGDSKAALMSIVFETLKSNYKKYYTKKGQKHKVQFKNKKNKWQDKCFKDLLIQIFKEEKFKFKKKELAFIKKIRQPTIHEGKFKSFKRDFKTFYSQRHLFERFILYLIRYKGSYQKWTQKGSLMISMK